MSAVRQARRGRAMRIRVHGNGPLSDLVVSALRCSGARVRHTNQRGATAADADLVVLTDYLVVDPALVRELHAPARRICWSGSVTATGSSGRFMTDGTLLGVGCKGTEHRRHRRAS